MGSSLLARLNRVQHQPGVLNVLARLGGEHQVGVESGVPASQEAGLDLGVLGQTGLTDLLLGQSVLLQCAGQRVLAFGALHEGLGAGERGPRDSMVEGLGLRLGRRRCGQGGLGFGGGAGLRQELDLLIDCTAQVVEGLADVGRVVVGLVGILRAGSSSGRLENSGCEGQQRTRLTSPAAASGEQASAHQRASRARCIHRGAGFYRRPGPAAP